MIFLQFLVLASFLYVYSSAWGAFFLLLQRCSVLSCKYYLLNQNDVDLVLRIQSHCGDVQYYTKQ